MSEPRDHHGQAFVNRSLDKLFRQPKDAGRRCTCGPTPFSIATKVFCLLFQKPRGQKPDTALHTWVSRPFHGKSTSKPEWQQQTSNQYRNCSKQLARLKKSSGCISNTFLMNMSDLQNASAFLVLFNIIWYNTSVIRKS